MSTERMSVNEYKIYTDGSRIGSATPGPGGWAAVIYHESTQPVAVSGAEPLTTNNRMELTAVIKALETVPEYSSVVIFSDSKYVVDAVNKGWILSWKEEDWKTGKNNERVNKDLWIRLLKSMERKFIKFKWVKAHADCKGNNLADEEAKRQAMSIQDTE